MLSRSTIVGLAACAALSATLVCRQPRAARAQQVIDRVIATVDDQPLTMQDLQTFAKLNNVSLPAGDSPTDEQTRRKLLNDLIEQTALEHEERDISVDDGAIDRYLSQLAATNHMTEDELRQQAVAHGMSWQQFRDQARAQVQRIELLQREVNDQIIIPQSTVEAYYKAHQSEFEVSQERFKLAQILIAVPPDAPPDVVAAAKKKAEAIRRRAVAGEDFAALARKYSDDDSASQGGELGEFKPGDILDSIEIAIAHLKSGQISPPVRTSHGFHIVKVEEHVEPGLLPLSEAQGQIRQKLGQAQMKARFKEWITQELLKNHSVHVYL